MSKRIYLSPSSQPDNLYAVDDTNEQEQCRKIAAALKEELDRCGFWCYAGLDGTMYTRAAESDKFGVDLHMPIHTNAFDGIVAGLRILISRRGGVAEQIAEVIMEHLAPITPGESDGITEMPNLYEIRATEAPCVYIEVGFHDNPEEAQWIIDHTREIVVAIAQALCEYYGVEYVDENEPVPSFDDVAPDKWYAQSIAYCVANGIMEGDGNGKFRPEEPITRAEVAAVVERLHKMLA